VSEKPRQERFPRHCSIGFQDVVLKNLQSFHDDVLKICNNFKTTRLQFQGSTSRYSTLSRSSVSSLDLNPSRFLSDRLSSTSLSSRPVRHGSHTEDVLSRFSSSSRERSTEPRASSSSSLSLSDSTSATTRSREGSMTKTRLGLDTSSTSASTTPARLEARGSAYTGSS
ncbi:Alcohol dehydrogenase 1, partial [Frankliniella fusca]